MTYNDHLRMIWEQRGRLVPEDVVEVARDPDHPLHGHFEWDDSSAAEEYRKSQARNLIRSFRVVYREPSETEAARSVRAWVSVPSEQGRAYHPTDAVAADPFLSALVLRDAEREWKAMHRKYGHLSEFVSLVKGDLDSVAS